MSQSERIILGIDPGTLIMGYGVIKVVGKTAYFVDCGVLDMRNIDDTYLTLRKIFEEVTRLIDIHLPDELAIESPFVAKNIQSTLKLGRAQGVALTAAMLRDIPVAEYAPLKIKMAVTGQGSASKHQVADMMSRILKIPSDERLKYFDATDGLATAYCHFLQSGLRSSLDRENFKNWKDFIHKNKDKIRGL